MSAIAALLSLDDAPVENAELAGVAARMARHGPDRAWEWAGPGGGLRLLRSLREITPEDRHARGVAEAGEWVVAGDVRLDARPALAAALGLSRAEADARSDELLFALALAKWGEDAPARMHGSFAVVAWERSRRRLHAWRDASGDVPLYVYRGARRVFAANRLPVLTAFPGVPREADVPAILNFITDQRQPVRTPFKGVEAMRAGEHRRYDRDGGCVTRFFRPPLDPRAWVDDEEKNPVEALRETLFEAVRDRLRLLGEPGGYCSAGLDSTTVCAMAAVELAKKGRAFRTYTSVPKPGWKPGVARDKTKQVWDESEWVRDLAKMHPNIIPTFVHAEGDVFETHLRRHVEDFGMPMRNMSNLAWLNRIRDVADADGVGMLFCGENGNSGYSLVGDAVPDLLEAGRWRELWRDPKISPRAILRALRLLGRERMGWGGQPNESPVIDYVHAEGAAALGWRRDEKRPAHWSVSRMRSRLLAAQDAQPGPGCHLARKVDPLQDRRVLELCCRIGPQWFRSGAQGRLAAREVMRGLVPDSIRLRRTRGRQAADFVVPDVCTRLDRLSASDSLFDRSVEASRVWDRDKILTALRRLHSGCAEDESTGENADAAHVILGRVLGGYAYLNSQAKSS